MSAVEHSRSGREPVLRRYATAFGRFWWDFLIGDTPELFVGTLAIVGVALGLRHERVAAIVLVPVVALAFLLGSVVHGRRRS